MVLMETGMWKKSRTYLISWWAMDPYVLARSSLSFCSRDLLPNAEFSIHPENPGTTAFWQMVTIYLFLVRYLVSFLASMEKKIFP